MKLGMQLMPAYPQIPCWKFLGTIAAGVGTPAGEVVKAPGARGSGK